MAICATRHECRALAGDLPAIDLTIGAADPRTILRSSTRARLCVIVTRSGVAGDRSPTT